MALLAHWNHLVESKYRFRLTRAYLYHDYLFRELEVLIVILKSTFAPFPSISGANIAL